jgi:hypothetical protein
VFFGRRQPFESITVTGLRYDVALAASRSVFAPPPHTRLLPAGPQPIASPAPRPLSAIRRQVSFPVLLPTWLPYKLRISRATVDGEQIVSLDYEGTGKHLNVGEGPIGCCLDSDPSKYNAPIPLPQGRTAYLLDVGAQDGGLILWWDQAATYIALSSASLTEGQLLRIAASMSGTATG